MSPADGPAAGPKKMGFALPNMNATIRRRYNAEFAHGLRNETN
jgi:hypothetical protein